MARFEEKVFQSSSGMCNIHTVIWNPDRRRYKKPVGVIQVAHGMIDHIERFEALAVYFADRGFVVVGNDHLGHGDSVASKEDWGYFGESMHGGDYLVKDMHRLTRIMKKKYPDVPYILVGHSMGSYMARKYTCLYGNDLDGAIFLGTGHQPKLIVQAGMVLARIAIMLKGGRYQSGFLNKLIFGAYNKRIADKRTDNDWISTDREIVEAYCNDEKCSFKFTANAYVGAFHVILYDICEQNIAKTRSTLPILFAAGKDDPVGRYGADVKKAYQIYNRYVQDVSLKLYDHCRHELHSEVNKEEIFADLYDWIMQKVCKQK